MIALKLFEANQVAEAFSLLEMGYSKEDPQACLNVADFIRKELIGKRAKSVPFYICAARDGDPEVLHTLSWLTTKPFRHRGVHPVVYKLLKKYSESGDPGVNYSMADFLYRTNVYMEHIEESIKHWEISAKGGIDGSHHRLGQIYSGKHSVRFDLKKSELHFEQCLVLKHDSCARDYGRIYLLGERVPQDIKKALDIFEASSQQGLYSGNLLLAGFQYDGKMVPKNKAMAIKTYQYAIKNDMWLGKDDYYRLYKCHKKGKLCKKEKTLQMKYLRLAARKIHGKAAYKLGKMYEKGKKVKKDLLEAFILYMTAIYDEYNPAIKSSNRIIKQWSKNHMEIYENVTRFKLFYARTHGRMKLSKTYDPVLNQGISLFFGLKGAKNQSKGLEKIQESIDLGNNDAKLVHKMLRSEFLDK